LNRPTALQPGQMLAAKSVRLYDPELYVLHICEKSNIIVLYWASIQSDALGGDLEKVFLPGKRGFSISLFYQLFSAPVIILQ